ncbi:PREDICTED: putative aspartate aminotransferase, cytoplasmic 2 [Elephantulus edwardii]|uniref:putative aspartate aminotransferase, cytoplasmic 2 n=1 Tax=Elephantulus edwardii TaxID=28737 RepID=UPI0003F06119|nr:PREDICTED: putative aspartate aminotransferase, cytoplasmic 2 [Elephantulus edwardii]
MPTLSVFVDVPMSYKLEGSLLKSYKQDDHPKKTFLAYRVCMSEDGQPWTSPVVTKLRKQIAQDPSLNYEYTPVMGTKSFIQASLELLFGKQSQAIVENRVGGVHTVGENGAFHLGARFLRTWHQTSRVVNIISFQKELYRLIFQDMGFTVNEYSLWDPKQMHIDSTIFINVTKQAPFGSVLVMGNIADCKLTQREWTKLMSIMKKKRIFPFFDIPSQGFSSGDLSDDSTILQFFVAQGFEFFCSQTLSKNFGIYDEGVGVLAVVALDNQHLLCTISQIMNFASVLWLNPPALGARLVTSVLCNPALKEEWKYSLKRVVENIMLIKEKVKEKLRLLGTPGSWDHITEQKGTHSYLGLNSQHVEYLVKKKHIYIPKNGRINFSSVNANNIDYIAQSISEAILFTVNPGVSSEVNDK